VLCADGSASVLYRVYWDARYSFIYWAWKLKKQLFHIIKNLKFS